MTTDDLTTVLRWGADGLSASLSGVIPINLRDTVTGFNEHNTARLVTAIRQAPGKQRMRTSVVLARVMLSDLETSRARALFQYSSSGNDMLKYKGFDTHRCTLYCRSFMPFVEVACRIYPGEHAYEDIHDSLRQIVLGLPCRTSFNDCLAQPCEGSFIHSLR